MIRIKVCGITRREDAEWAAACGVDAVGFVFAESPRQVSASRAREIMRGLDPFVTAVGVFVNASPDEVRRTLEATGCSVAQLHGEEGPEYVEALAPYAVVKALRVPPEDPGGQGLEMLARTWAAAGGRAVLLDTYVPGSPGGTGQRFRVEAAQRLVSAGLRVIVAGGLTPENVGEVVARARPHGVDVSSGVEAAPGRKDPEKVRRFVQVVREAEAATAKESER